MRKTERCLIGLFLLSTALSDCQARNQWEINHPDLPSKSAVPVTAAGSAMPADFWSGNHPALLSRIPPGVVLTTVMEQTLSSAKSKVGDAFSLLLPDGYARGGYQVIPAGSRIVGAVTAVSPARSLQGGNPGNLQVTLQSLLLPDGQHVSFYGLIDSNPAHAFKSAPARRNLGSDLRDYGQQVTAFFQSFTSGLGTTMAKRHRGLDFTLAKGELVPVRLNRTLIMPASAVQPQTVRQLQSSDFSALGQQAQPGAKPQPGGGVPAADPIEKPSSAVIPGLAVDAMPPVAPPRDSAERGQPSPAGADFPIPAAVSGGSDAAESGGNSTGGGLAAPPRIEDLPDPF